jgi:phosphatidylglycerophosphate synthase
VTRAIVIDPGVDPSLRVARLGLVERWRRALAALKLDVVVVAPDGLAAALGESAEAGADDDAVLVAWADFVVDPASLDAFNDAIVAEPPGAGAARVETAELGPGPVLALPAATARALAASGVPADAAASADALAAFVAARPGAAVQPVRLAAAYWGRVADAASARAAVWGLLVRLRWRQGGIVAHYLNRPVSMLVSKWLVDTRVTPNQTTIVNFFIGIAGVWLLFSPGGYLGALLGMLILHVNSVLDGVDGELARLRHESSTFGSYLDSVTDEILNTATLIGVGYNLAHDPAFGWPHYQTLGVFAGVVSFLYAAVHWHCRWKHGLGLYWWWDAYKPRKKVQASNSLRSYAMRLFQKDGLLFIYLLGAAVRILPVLLFVSATAAAAVLVLLFTHIFVKRARW